MRKAIVAASALFLFALAAAACAGGPSVCPTDELVAPALDDPADGATVNTLTPSLTWSYPASCVPEGYRIDLSVTSDFSDTSLSGGTGDSSTSWMPGEDLVDCTQYSWRVAPINDTTLGPFSASWSFNVDAAGTCSSPAPESSMEGVVWHDVCATYFDTSGMPLLPGCVEAEIGPPVANGLLEPGEPGLEGIRVDLGAGACLSTGLAMALTGPDGAYSFAGLSAGDYCVSIDATSPTNSVLMIPGSWTYPTPDVEPATADITLEPGEAASDVNFGWDFWGLPVPPTPVATPTPVGAEIFGLIWNDICEFTGGVANEPLVLGQGCIGDPNGVWGANGIRDAGEPPFVGVTFRLAAGACANPPYASASSNSAGWFGFVDVPPGTYCLIMDVFEPGNTSRLIPGGSTTHSMTGGKILIPFEVLPGDDQLDFAIGWEFQHLG
jgi:hypothetical protein